MEDHNKKYIPSDSADQPSTSKPESGVSEEDRKRINAYAKGIANGAGDGNADFDDYAYEIAMRAAEYEHRHMVDKQAELIADNTVLKNKLSEFEKNWREINHKYIDLQSENARLKAELIARAPEMAAEIERLKDRINTYLDAVHSIAHKRIDLQDVVDAIRGVSNQTEEIDRQAAELSKLRQENEAKRSDLTDKLEEAVQHMDNGHTAQATTLIYEVIGELEPKGE